MALTIIIKKKASTPAPAPLVSPPPAPAKPAIAAPSRTLDGMCREVLSRCPNGVVSWWLMAAYAYEEHSMPIISDGLFDEMSRDIAARWDTLVHPHKNCINHDCTKTALGVKFPLTAMYATRVLIKDLYGVSINVQ